MESKYEGIGCPLIDEPVSPSSHFLSFCEIDNNFQTAGQNPHVLHFFWGPMLPSLP